MKTRSSRALPYYLADVFTVDPFCGNTLAVFPDAQGVDAAMMQSIARELNFSESAFVCGSAEPNSFHVRIFAPTLELPFAGHPTIGTAHVLASINTLPLRDGENFVTFKEGIGDIPVRIVMQDGEPDYTSFTAAPAEFGPSIAVEDMAGVLGLRREEIRTDHYGLEAVSCGVPFHMVPVTSFAALQKLQFDYVSYQMWLADTWAKSICVFVPDPEQSGKIHSRVFSPSFGFLEDPATGAAAAALGAYMSKRDPRPSGKMRWEIRQGEAMGRPSRLLVEVEKRSAQPSTIRVEGQTVIVGDGKFFIPL